MIWTSVLGSTIAGYISIAFWLIVFIPQLQENFKRKNGDGLSLTFLLIWLAGDLFNLAGVILEDLMFTMFLLALWYTVADISLIWQVIYYKQCVTKEVECDGNEAIVLSARKQLKQRRVSLERPLSKVDTNSLERQLSYASSVHEPLLEANDVNDDDDVATNSMTNDTEDVIFIAPPKIKPIWINLIGASVLVTLTVASFYAYVQTSAEPTTSKDDGLQLLPQIMGWSSAALYVGSRVPQLIKNWREQSTDGLSSGMFVCAVFGNIFFSLSIFLRSSERKYLIVNLPWIIGSLGTVIFDFMIFLQFCVFNRRKLKHRAD